MFARARVRGMGAAWAGRESSVAVVTDEIGDAGVLARVGVEVA